MRKVRNAIIILILCIIGAYKAYNPASAPVGLNLPPSDVLHDALSGDSSRAGRANRGINAARPGLRLSNNDDDQLRDSVAGNGIPGAQDAHGNTEDSTPPPPRGGDHQGFGSFSGPNPGSQLPHPGRLSPSGPK